MKPHVPFPKMIRVGSMNRVIPEPCNTQYVPLGTNIGGYYWSQQRKDWISSWDQVAIGTTNLEEVRDILDVRWAYLYCTGRLPEDKETANQSFDIWVEGFKISGGDGQAYKIGTVRAQNFKQACIAANALGLFKGCGEFDADKLTVWGCRLFPTESEARASFG